MDGGDPTLRLATVDDADEVARLLHDFNTEYGVASPGPAVIAGRLRTLLAGERTVALVAGEPVVGLALVTLRPNVWYEGCVALLDELYVVPPQRGQGIGSGIVAALLGWARSEGVSLVEINVDEGDVDAQRFYERHGFSVLDPGADERALYWSQELAP